MISGFSVFAIMTLETQSGKVLKYELIVLVGVVALPTETMKRLGYL